MATTDLEFGIDLNADGALREAAQFDGVVENLQSATAELANLLKQLGVTAEDSFKKGADSGKKFGDGVDSSLERVKNRSRDVLEFAGIGGLFTAGALGLKEFVDQSIRFDAGVKELSAITGVAGEQLNNFANGARELALQFGGDATDQLTSYKTLLSRLGLDIAKSPAALKSMTESVNILSKATGDDATASVDALTTSMLQFRVSLDNPTQAAAEMANQMNVMAAGAKLGASEVPQIAEALKQSGVAAVSANVSFEETNAALQVLAAGGKFGSEGGIALRNVFGFLQKQSSEGRESLAKMGLTVEQLGESLTTKGLSETLGLLSEGMSKLGSDAERNATLMQLFGQENAAAAGILINGASQMDTFRIAMTGTNTAVEQAAINEASFESQMEKLKATFGDLAIGVGQFVLPVLSTFASVLGSSVTFLNQHKTALLFVVAAYAAFKAVTAIKEAGGVATLFSDATSKVKEYATNIFTKAIPGTIAQATATTGAGLAQRALNLAMNASPILLLATGLITLVSSLDLFGSSSKNLEEQTTSTGEALASFQKKSEEAAAFDKQAEGISSLVATYEELSSKSSLTAVEQSKLDAVTKQLADNVPGAVDGYNSLTGSITISTEAVREFVEEQKKLKAEEKQESLEGLVDQAGDLVDTFRDATKEVEELRNEKKLLSNQDIAAVRDHANGLAITLGLMDSSKEKVKETNKELAEQRTKLDGAREKLKEVVKSFTDAGFSAEQIAEKTGLTAEEARKLGAVTQEIKDKTAAVAEETAKWAFSVSEVAAGYDAAEKNLSAQRSTGIQAEQALVFALRTQKGAVIELADAKGELQQISRADAERQLQDLRKQNLEVDRAFDKQKQLDKAVADRYEDSKGKEIDLIALQEAKNKLAENSLKLTELQNNGHKLTIVSEGKILALQLTNIQETIKLIEREKARAVDKKRILDLDNKSVDAQIKYEELLGKSVEHSRKISDEFFKQEQSIVRSSIEMLKTISGSTSLSQLFDVSGVFVGFREEVNFAVRDFQTFTTRLKTDRADVAGFAEEILSFADSTGKLNENLTNVDALATLRDNALQLNSLLQTSGKSTADLAGVFQRLQVLLKAIGAEQDNLEKDRLEKFRTSFDSLTNAQDFLSNVVETTLESQGATEEEVLKRRLERYREFYATQAELARKNNDPETLKKVEEEKTKFELDAVRKRVALTQREIANFKSGVERVLGSGLDTIFAHINEGLFGKMFANLRESGGLLGDLAATLAETALSIGEEVLKSLALNAATSAITAAFMTASMAEIAAAAAPAAALVSLASFGANSIAANAGLLSTIALAKSLSAIKFGDGGVISSPTLALYGERGEREFVVPESDFDDVLREKQNGMSSGISKRDMRDAYVEALTLAPRETVLDGFQAVKLVKLHQLRTAARD